MEVESRKLIKLSGFFCIFVRHRGLVLLDLCSMRDPNKEIGKGRAMWMLRASTRYLERVIESRARCQEQLQNDYLVVF